MGQTDHSSREILPCVVCLSVIVKGSSSRENGPKQHFDKECVWVESFTQNDNSLLINNHYPPSPFRNQIVCYFYFLRKTLILKFTVLS